MASILKGHFKFY